MDRWWRVLKDAILTGTGVTLIITQAFSASPSDALLAVGLALTAPSVYDHAKAVLSGPTGGRSSPSAPERPSSPASSPPE